MAKARTERLLNLLFVLLNSNTPLTAKQIRDRVPGYVGNDEAKERKLERDKADLLALGIPLETKPVDLFHDDVVGYIIDRKNWLMPEILLTSEERTYLSLAASAWQSAQLSAAAKQAVRRIDAQESDELPVVPVSLAKGRRHIAEILEGITDNKTVAFDYVGLVDANPVRRTVDPWRALLHSGHWYLIGFDQDKGELRSFRTDRIVGEIAITKDEILEPVPTDFEVQDIVAQWESGEAVTLQAKLLVRPGRGASLRLLASDCIVGTEWDELTVPYFHESQLVGLLAGACDVVRIVEPVALHDAVSRVIVTTLKAHSNGK